MTKGLDFFFLILPLGAVGYEVLCILGSWITLRDVAKAIGFRDVNVLAKKISGFIDRYRVDVVKQKTDWIISVQAGDLPCNLLLESEDQLDQESDIQTGEWEFDKNVRVVAESRAWALAILGPEMRKQLCFWIGRGLRLQGGVITVRESIDSDIPALVNNLGGLAKELSLEVGEIPVALLKNFKNEKQGGVRLKILVALSREAPSSKSAQEAFDLGLEDEDDGVRLISCVLQESLPKEKIARVWASPRTLDTLLLAMNLLLRELPTTLERSADVLRGALLAPRQEIQLNAIRLLGRVRDKNSLETLFKMGGQPLAPEVLGAIVESVTLIGGAAAEPFLVDLLKARGEECPISVFKALGRVGSWVALDPLLEITKGFSMSPSVIEAGTAIGFIRARLGPVEQGALSVSSLDEADGGISLSGAGGELSGEDNVS
jgi:hypothetical protein